MATSPIPANNDAAPVVLHVCDAAAFARFGRMFRQLTLATAEDGARVLLLTDSPELAREVENTHVTSLVTGLIGWRGWRVGARIESGFDESPNVIHAWGTGGLDAVATWAERRGIPVLIYVTSREDALWINRHGLSSRHQLALASGGLADPLRARWSSQVALATRLPPALILPDAPDDSEASSTMGVVWSGTATQRAGLDLLIEAARRLPADSVPAQFALLGDGPALRAVWQRTRRTGLLDRFSIVPDPTAWDRVMAAADVYVSPVSSGQVSLAPVLAMALARLVIVPSDEPSEWFADGGTVWRFDAGSAASLAECLARAARDPALRLAAGARARAYVRQHHAISALGQALCGLYRSLESARRR